MYLGQGSPLGALVGGSRFGGKQPAGEMDATLNAVSAEAEPSAGGGAVDAAKTSAQAGLHASQVLLSVSPAAESRSPNSTLHRPSVQGTTGVLGDGQGPIQVGGIHSALGGRLRQPAVHSIAGLRAKAEHAGRLARTPGRRPQVALRPQLQVSLLDVLSSLVKAGD